MNRITTVSTQFQKTHSYIVAMRNTHHQKGLPMSISYHLRSQVSPFGMTKLYSGFTWYPGLLNPRREQQSVGAILLTSYVSPTPSLAKHMTENKEGMPSYLQSFRSMRLAFEVSFLLTTQSDTVDMLPILFPRRKLLRNFKQKRISYRESVAQNYWKGERDPNREALSRLTLRSYTNMFAMQPGNYHSNYEIQQHRTC